jgi:hypothetical protein
MNEFEAIWVEVETNEGGSSTNAFNGQISILDYEDLYNGTYEKPFLKLQNTHWYRFPDDDEEKMGKERTLREYGKGLYSQYQGETLLKVTTIITVQRLSHGPRTFQSE